VVCQVDGLDGVVKAKEKALEMGGLLAKHEVVERVAFLML